MLQSDMSPTQKPTAALVKLSIKVIQSRENLRALREKLNLVQESHQNLMEQYALMTANPGSPQSVIDVTDAEEVMATLTKEELDRLRNLAKERTAAARGSQAAPQEEIPGPTASVTDSSM